MTAIVLSPEEKIDLAERCWRSHPEFCRVFLAEWFPTKMPWVHRGIIALIKGQTDFLLDFGKEVWRDEIAEWTLEDLQKILTNFIEEGSGKSIFELTTVDGEPKILINSATNVAIIMPRGFSKTTLINSINLANLLYKKIDFFLYVSESGAHAERQLGTIKSEIDDEGGTPNNELIYEVFGLHAPGRQSPLKWTENYIETLKGVMVGAVGRGGQIRGFGKRAKRPKQITFDDIEDAESVLSDTQRKKDSTWFFGTALPTVAKGGRNIVIGTLLHTDAILNKVIKSRDFTAVRFGAIDRQGDALWPFMMDLEEIEQKKQTYAEVGELSSFFLEFMSEYKDDEARIFPENKLVYVTRPLERFIGIALAHDPAISEKATADFASFAVTGIEAGGLKHVLDFYAQKGMDPADAVEKFFELHFKWMAHLPPEQQKHGIEAIAFQRALISLVRAEQFRRSRTHGVSAYFEVLPIFHGKVGKEQRVRGILKPLIHAGYLTFQERWPELHTQFTDWPNGKKDGPDVVAMSIRLLDPYVALNLSEDTEDLAKDTAPPLSTVLGGRSYRHAP